MSENAGKVRSPSKERELDSKIAQINLRNKAMEERQKTIQSEAKTARPIKVIDQISKKTENKQESKQGSPNTVSRAWDNGKTPAAQWKTNVPELGDQQKDKDTTIRKSNRNTRTEPSKQQKTGQSTSGIKQMPGFQHDDRFQDKDVDNKDSKDFKDVKERTPDENRKPQRNQRMPGKSLTKHPIFSRLSKSNQKGESVPFQKPQTQQSQLGDRPRRSYIKQDDDSERNPKPRNIGRFLTRTDEATNEDPSGEQSEQQSVKKKSRNRRHRPNKITVQGNSIEAQKTEEAPKRKTPLIRPSRRTIPDHVQVRQVVRQLIGRVCMQERREQLGLPSIEKESEV